MALLWIAVLYNRNLPLAERELNTATEENAKRVFKLQKRAARVILDANIGDRSKDLFRRLDWLPFKDEVNLQQCSLIFRCIS